jgi:hypothetical protein
MRSEPRQRKVPICGFRALLLSCARRRPRRGPRDARNGRHAGVPPRRSRGIRCIGTKSPRGSSRSDELAIASRHTRERAPPRASWRNRASRWRRASRHDCWSSSISAATEGRTDAPGQLLCREAGVSPCARAHRPQRASRGWSPRRLLGRGSGIGSVRQPATGRSPLAWRAVATRERGLPLAGGARAGKNPSIAATAAGASRPHGVLCTPSTSATLASVTARHPPPRRCAPVPSAQGNH